MCFFAMTGRNGAYYSDYGVQGTVRTYVGPQCQGA